MRKKLGLAFFIGLAIAAVTVYLVLTVRGDRPGSFQLEERVPSSGEGFSAALQQTVGSPLRPGHRVELLPDDTVFTALQREIRAARSTVHLVVYIWTAGTLSGRMVQALQSRNAGVRCRILIDAIGGSDRPETLEDELRRIGCELRLFRKERAPIARNHRKIAVFDGRIGITGGFAIDDRWAGADAKEPLWRDTNVLVEGHAVGDMQEAFAEDWQEAGGDLLPPEAFPDAIDAGPARAAFVRSFAAPVVTRAERLSQLAIAAAHTRLWIANAYFVPSEPVEELLQKRAGEKVDVRVLVPGDKSDSRLAVFLQRRRYDDLIDHGVRVWEYSPSMMHAKTMVVDDTLGIVGSVNLDPLSLNRLEEGALVVEDRAFNAELAKLFEQDLSRSAEQKE